MSKHAPAMPFRVVAAASRRHLRLSVGRSPAPGAYRGSYTVTVDY